MSWSWRMPRDLPWETPYPLARDTAAAVLAQGRCDNFGLLMERYLAFGDNRGQLQLLRELTDRRALVPDFVGLHELIAAHDVRWQDTALDLGAITFSARPSWRVIVGLGTNDLLEGGITLHPIHGFPIVPASAAQGCHSLLCDLGVGSPRGGNKYLAGKTGGPGTAPRRPGVPGGQPCRYASDRARRDQPDLWRLLP